jgi:lipoprotein-anchoring transpeptidase ErfK/SrfK
MIEKILKGEDRKIWKLEDRLKYVENEINLKKKLSLNEINSLSDSIALLKYNLNKGSLKRIVNDKSNNIDNNYVNSIIKKLSDYRDNKYELKKNNDNNNVYEIMEIYSNKKLGENKFYYLNDRLNAIETRLDKIDNCSLKDIDSLKYILISLEKDSYMKRKAKNDENFSKLKLKIEEKIKNVISKSQDDINKYLKTNIDDIDKLKRNKVSIPENNFPNINKKQIPKKYDEPKLGNENHFNDPFEEEIYNKSKKTKRLGKFALLSTLGALAFSISSLFYKPIPNENIVFDDTNEIMIDKINKPKDTINLIEDMKKDLKKHIDLKINNYEKLESVKDNYSNFKYIVDKNNQELFIMGYNGLWEIIDSYNISTGRNKGNKERKGDNKTPEGIFKVQSIENSSNWTVGDRKNVYGPYFIRLDTGFKGIGLHETDENHLLGLPASEGCIRLPPNLAKYLVEKKLIKKGTEVEILSEETYLTLK